MEGKKGATCKEKGGRRNKKKSPELVDTKKTEVNTNESRKRTCTENSADKPQATAANNTQIDKELKKEYQKNKTRFQQIEEKLAQLNRAKLSLEASDGFT